MNFFMVLVGHTFFPKKESCYVFPKLTGTNARGNIFFNTFDTVYGKGGPLKKCTVHCASSSSHLSSDGSSCNVNKQRHLPQFIALMEMFSTIIRIQ